MQIRTFTNFWAMEKKLYSISDYQLPVAIPLRVLGVFVLAAVPWGLLMFLIHMPLTSPGYLVWIGPPALVGFFASRPIFDGKTLFQFLRSKFTFMFFENKKYKGLVPDLDAKNTKIYVTSPIFTRQP
jgi:hypothetical protein